MFRRPVLLLLYLDFTRFNGCKAVCKEAVSVCGKGAFRSVSFVLYWNMNIYKYIKFDLEKFPA